MPKTVTLPAQAVKEPQKVPWYTLNPKHIRLSKFTRWFLIILGPIFLLNLISIKPLWQFGWTHYLYSMHNYLPLRAENGVWYAGGAWVTSRTIVVYGAPGVSPARTELAANALRGLVQELKLDMTVRSIPIPRDAEASLHSCLVRKEGEELFNYSHFIALRLRDRGSRYAEVVIIRQPIKELTIAQGMTLHPPGICVLHEEVTDSSLARHEGAHLLGYDKHDSLPFWVIGYPEAFNPNGRDTLMTLTPSNSEALSPRAKDALIAYWRGLERQRHQKFFH